MLLQSATILLPSVIGITKCDRTVYRERYRSSYWLKRAGSWRYDFFYFGMPVRRLFEDDPMRSKYTFSHLPKRLLYNLTFFSFLL